MTNTRPLLKHIRDHDALFGDLVKLRLHSLSQLNLSNYAFHKVPKLVTESGERLTIEPERSIVVPNFRLLKSIKSILQAEIPQLSLISQSDIGFRYPTAAMAGLDAPFIKRIRSEYFHQIDEHRDICRPINFSYGIKSRGKADNRQEYEVYLPNEHLNQLPLPFLLEKYCDDLPDDVRHFVNQPSKIYGWMGVKRAAFEMFYRNPSEIGDLIICIGFSLDAYNIGANPDLSYSEAVKSSIVTSNAELEWEVMGYYAPLEEKVPHDAIWSAINHTLHAIAQPLENIYAPVILPINASKTERILHTMQEIGVTEDWVNALDLQPHEFLTTSSKRPKRHDPTRSINFLGRLNRLFYNPHSPLPSLKTLHELIASPL